MAQPMITLDECEIQNNMNRAIANGYCSEQPSVFSHIMNN